LELNGLRSDFGQAFREGARLRHFLGVNPGRLLTIAL
jgi:hypothetical protein